MFRPIEVIAAIWFDFIETRYVHSMARIYISASPNTQKYYGNYEKDLARFTDRCTAKLWYILSGCFCFIILGTALFILYK
jgi:hypothetical protein